ncbi:DUF3995 domain-containing protein [Mesorhizobium australicum]|uniref:DUF3995 domain-containing protein n=1 Tax=Mesorhizobium australicum TaxID=536018 RepID=A0A1X7NA09_9HYPH|nr:DUF3995 domain-containing protein [Mesorhizobium australicum]SMH33885.1 Protein of unknown function [Mesorhizobium australicum]
MTLIALALTVVLTFVAGLHVYWGIGGVWPGTDQRSLARAVVGFRGVDATPSPTACFAVAACLVLAALWPAALAGLFASPFQLAGLVAGAVMLALVFLARGIAGFTPAWRRLTPEEPFATNDRRFFSPLCLALGAGFLVLAFERALS